MAKGATAAKLEPIFMFPHQGLQYMTRKNWGSYAFLVAVGVLAGWVGLITPGCTVAPYSSQPSTQGNNVPNTNAPIGDTQVNIENTANAAEVVSLQKSMQYKEARKILIRQGWQPDLTTSTGEPPNLNNLAVKEVFDLGYKEVEDCSGSGLGLCRFEFINQKGEKLVVVATKAESDSKEPLVRNWFIEKTDGTQPTSVSPNDDRFVQQEFSQTLFKQIHQINKECGFYSVASPCSSRTYAFRDVVLTSTRLGTESITHTLIPKQPVSRKQALAYSFILNDGQELDLSKLETHADKLIYRGCPYDAGAKEPASLCVAELNLTTDGSISRIAFTHISP